ncbi:MAG: hypothetical protein E6929_07745 [Clostridium sp.]|nr:hypothetical protein [Clostridium sp.]
MINSKRLNKLKKDVYNKIGIKIELEFVVVAKEGIFKGDFGVYQTMDEYMKLDYMPSDLRVYDYSKCSINDFKIISSSRKHMYIFNLSKPNPYGVEGGHIPEDVERALRKGELLKNDK